MMKETGLQLDIRRSVDRGRTELGWLHSRHSFSFGRYHNPARMSFGALRVLNDDIVEPSAGFGEHEHANMEIITWVLRGELAHRDSTGQQGVIRPGDVQVMTAGTGIRHSEMNASATEPVHFLQIWIEPATAGVDAAYSQRAIPKHEHRNTWRIMVSPDGAGDSERIHQDTYVSVADLEAGRDLEFSVPEGRFGYLHIATGSVRIGANQLETGDAVTLSGPCIIEVHAIEQSQLLGFELA